MKAAGYEVSALSTGRFRLDGGAMYGNVPRALWARHHEPDDRNRIELELRVLLIEGQGRTILVDTGTGHLWNEKEQGIFATETGPRPGVVAALQARGIEPEAVTDVILTHLHFDHAGGVSRRRSLEDPTPVLSFPAARHHVQRANLETARQPNQRERASYLPRHREPLEAGDLVVQDGDGEVLPGIHVEVSHGHTQGLQIVRVGDGEGAIVFPADAIPLATHVQLPWTMGYDLCPRSLMAEKERVLSRAAAEGHLVVLEHDVHRDAVRVVRDGERFRAAEDVTLSPEESRSP